MKDFKKIIISFVILVSFFAIILRVNAASLSVKISASSDKVVVGDTVTYTVTLSSGEKLGSIVYHVSYDSKLLEWKSGETKSVYVTPDGEKKSATFTFKFKAKASGTATFKFIVDEAIDFNDNAFSYNSTTSRSTTIITQAQLTASYSKNNYLSKLAIDGFDLTPNFNKDTSTYSLTVENDVRSINITGSKEDSKSTVKGLGEHALEEGVNKIDIVVTAQNGSSRTYTINVTVKELTPIVVEAYGQSLTVARKKEQLHAPNTTFTETIIKIDEEEVPAFVNETVGITLVGLKDDAGEVSLYTYKDGEYLLYKEFSFNSIIVTSVNTENIPEGYTKTTIKVNDQDLTAYQDPDNEDYYLFGATNLSTGEEHIYQYDAKENTIQIFNDNVLTKVNEKDEKINSYMYIIIGLGLFLIITYIAILVSSIRKKNSKKVDNKIEKKEEHMKKNEVFDQEIEQNEEKDDKMEDDISEKSKKKKK